MPSKTVNFTDKLIKEIAAAADGETYTDTEVSGLTARAAKNHEVTFTVTMRVNGKKVPKRLNVFHPKNYTVSMARNAANDQKSHWRIEGVTPKVNKTLDQMIDYYKEQRLQGEPMIVERVKKKDGMPEDWEDQVKKLRAICKPLLHHAIGSIKRTDVLKCKVDYLQWLAKGNGKTRAPSASLDDRPLRQSFVALAQILQYAVDLGWLSHTETKGLKTKKYKNRPRFLLPGEWQRIAPVLDMLPNDGGLLIRFLLATGVRLEMALGMRFDSLDETRQLPADPTRIGTKNSMTIRMWSLHANVMKANRSALVPLVGESLKIVQHFEQQKKKSKDARETVFPAKVIQMWRNDSAFYQRALEAATDTARWHRHDLRRTLATYLKYVKLGQGYVSMVLSHASGTQATRNDPEAAQATRIYTQDDHFGDCLGDNEDLHTIDTGDLFEVARAHLRVQELFKQMEAGERSPLLMRIQSTLAMGPRANEMMMMHGINRALIEVQSPDKIKMWAKSRKLDAWAATLTGTLTARKAKSKQRQAA